MSQDLLVTDQGPLVADNSELNVLFIHSAIDDMGLSPYAFRVLCHLKRRADGNGKAFLGMRSIASKCCISIGKVHQSIKELQKQGILVVKARGENVSNAYLLTGPKAWRNKDGTPFKHPSLGCSPHEQVRSCYEQGVHQMNGAVHPMNERISTEGNPP